jgi:polyphosphate glucokinase
MTPANPKVLVVDVGGTHIKIMATGQNTRREAPSGPTLTPRQLMKALKELTAEWTYDVVSLGYPGTAFRGRITAEPANLGPGWVTFDFDKAFGCPVKIINDAAMQALGSYQGGSMLFLGFGTGLGSALVIDGVVQPLELAHLPYKKGQSYEDYVGVRGMKRRGKKRWRAHVLDVATRLATALQTSDLVMGGGNVKLLERLPEGARLGDNANAFKGGFRLWGGAGGGGAMSESRLAGGRRLLRNTSHT